MGMSVWEDGELKYQSIEWNIEVQHNGIPEYGNEIKRMEWSRVWLTGGEEGERVQGCQVSEKSSRKVSPSFLLLTLFLFIFIFQPRLQVAQKQTGREKISPSLPPLSSPPLTWRCSHYEPLYPATQRRGEGENLMLTYISTDSVYTEQRNND